MSNKLIYTYTSPRVSLLLKVRNRLAGWIDRRSILEQFLKDNNIDVRNINAQTFTRLKYVIRTHHAEFLANIRDQRLLREAVRVRKLHNYLLSEIDTQKTIHEYELSRLQLLNEELSTVHKELTRPNITSLQKAHLQGHTGTLEASIANQQNTVAAIERTVEDYGDRLRDNKKTFQEFRKDLRNTFDVLLSDYIKVAGRKLNHIGFTYYDSKMRDYSDDTEMQIKELTDGK